MLPQTLVFDASVLFNVGHRDHLGWLIHHLAQIHRLVVPRQVLQEIAPEQVFDYIGFCQRYFEIYETDFGVFSAETLAILHQTLDEGEISVIASAAELAGAVILDERRARSLAKQRGLQTIGTIGLLAYAIEKSWCNDLEALLAVRELISNRFSLPNANTVHSFAEYVRLLS